MPVDQPDNAAIYMYLPIRNNQDVQNFISYAADVWSRYPKRIVSAVHPSLPIGPHEVAKAGRLDLNPVGMDLEILSAWKYIHRIRIARREGKPLPVEATKIRICALCEQSWPSFAHFLTSPNAPKHLRCKGCFKRVPVVSFQSCPYDHSRTRAYVKPCDFLCHLRINTLSLTYSIQGVDIQELPERRAQPNALLRLEAVLTSGALSPINTTQLCEAKDCPIYGEPHSIGLFSHSQCRAPRSCDVASTSDTVNDEAFWGGNDLVPIKFLSWARTIAREEQLWRQGGRKGVSMLYEVHPKASIDKMREGILAFRAYVSTAQYFSSFLPSPAQHQC